MSVPLMSYAQLKITMKEKAINDFRRDFIEQILIHQIQFEDWLRILFFLDHKLNSEYDEIYQGAFYVKIYESLTSGLNYAIEVFEKLKDGYNLEKSQWFKDLISGLENIKLLLDDSEFSYIEYRRHSASHIFQTQYEHIQDDLRIKKERKGKNLKDLNDNLQNLIKKHGSDKNIDLHLNKILHFELSKLYNLLTK